ncbi:hypothetical protein QQX98_008215 [Neonectria punicea]|uniref:Uncharacterized protein n=1 Tax=Neonectria punicea TaxID=979145 RepID=A0ABR1GVW7_9HYPO
MCLTAVAHFTLCETRRPAVIHLGYDQTVYQPYEEPRKCHHGKDAKPSQCVSHGSCCHLLMWQMCFSKGVASACRGWQAYHLVFRPNDKRFIIRKLGDPMKPSDKLRTSDPKLEGLCKLRRDFFGTGAQIVDLALHANRLVDEMWKDDCSLGKYRDLLKGLKETFKLWQKSCYDLDKLQREWEKWNSRGQMEQSPPRQRRFDKMSHFVQPIQSMDAQCRWPGTSLDKLPLSINGPSIKDVLDAAQRWMNEKFPRDSSKSNGRPPNPIELCGKGQPPPVFATSIHWNSPRTRHMSESPSPCTVLRAPAELLPPLPWDTPEDVFPTSHAELGPEETLVVSAPCLTREDDQVPFLSKVPCLGEVSKGKKPTRAKKETMEKKTITAKKTTTRKKVTKTKKMTKTKKETESKETQGKKRKHTHNNSEDEGPAPKVQRKTPEL